MPEFLTEAYVIWFAVGFALALAELAAPGFILIFFALGAWVVSLSAAFFDLSLTWQIGVFLAGSVLSLLLLRKFFMRIFTGSTGGTGDADGLNEPDHLGRGVLVTKAIRPDRPGEIKYRGTFWRAVSDVTIPEGAAAVISGDFPDDRTTFKVKPVPKGE